MSLETESAESPKVDARDFTCHACDPIAMVNANGRIEVVNRRLSTFFGYETHELIGQPIEILMPKSENLNHIGSREFYRAHQTEVRSVQLTKVLAKQKNGTEVTVDIDVTPVHAENGQAVLATIRDMTERYRIESNQEFLLENSRKLNETTDYQERLQIITTQLANRLGDTCVIYIIEGDTLVPKASASGDPNFHFAVFQKLMNYPLTLDATFGSPLVARTGQAQLSTVVTDEDIEQVAIDGPHLAYLKNLGVKSYIGQPLIVRNKVVGVLALTRREREFSPIDLALAGQVALHSALAIDNARLFREAQKAIQVREDIVAIVSHDLKNPLAAIELGVEHAKRFQPPETTLGPWLKASDIIDSIGRSTVTALNLIRDLLDYSQLESGSLKIEKSKTRVDDLLRRSNEMFLPLAVKSGITLATEISADLPLLSCDSERIFEVLSNLISNAMRFTPNDGFINVSVSLQKNKIQFSIADTGSGIADNDLPNIFDRYWQAKRTKRSGSGLGLSISKGIIEGHGGKIWAQSKLGHGSSFHFNLPIT